ncbi:MAG: hypothetical protein Q7K57_60120 [Burkholderiaceae bacterium]|nr:hypothetical protein [Burkholderiaceae bacterium]
MTMQPTSPYPKAAVRLCLVNMMRHSLSYVNWKLRPGHWPKL